MRKLPHLKISRAPSVLTRRTNTTTKEEPVDTSREEAKVVKDLADKLRQNPLFGGAPSPPREVAPAAPAAPAAPPTFGLVNTLFEIDAKRIEREAEARRAYEEANSPVARAEQRL